MNQQLKIEKSGNFQRSNNTTQLREKGSKGGLKTELGGLECKIVHGNTGNEIVESTRALIKEIIRYSVAYAEHEDENRKTVNEIHVSEAISRIDKKYFATNKGINNSLRSYSQKIRTSESVSSKLRSGFNNSAIRRIARRAGVKQWNRNREICDEIRIVMFDFLRKILKDAIHFTDIGRRKTVIAEDIVLALRNNDIKLYGYSDRK